MLSSKSFLLSGESKGPDALVGDGDFVAASGVCVESTSKYDGALHSECDIIATENQYGIEPAIKFPTEDPQSESSRPNAPSLRRGGLGLLQ